VSDGGAVLVVGLSVLADPGDVPRCLGIVAGPLGYDQAQDGCIAVVVLSGIDERVV
jgi:hypothetical protein